MLLDKRSVFAAKIESTPGTVETLTAAEGAFNVYDFEINPDVPMDDREAQGSADNLSSVPGQRKGTATFKTDSGWSGTGLPTWASVLLPGCAYVNSSQIFSPTTESPGSNVKTLTIGKFLDGKLKRIAGAVGNAKAVMVAGKIVLWEWEFTGVWQPVIDSAMITPTHPTDTAIRYASATTTFNSNDQCLNQLTFDMGNEIGMKECGDNAAGIDYFFVRDRKPIFTLDPEATLVATEDKYGNLLGDTEAAFSVELDGPAGGTSNATLEIAAPKAQVQTLAETEREGMAADDVTLQANKNGANKDGDVTITFTDLVA